MKATQITLGARGDSAVQIVSGLDEGAKIVVVRAPATTTGTTGAGTGRTGGITGAGGFPGAGAFAGGGGGAGRVGG